MPLAFSIGDPKLPVFQSFYKEWVNSEALSMHNLINGNVTGGSPETDEMERGPGESPVLGWNAKEIYAAKKLKAITTRLGPGIYPVACKNTRRAVAR
jgi:hypothetical protein